MPKTPSSSSNPPGPPVSAKWHRLTFYHPATGPGQRAQQRPTPAPPRPGQFLFSPPSPVLLGPSVGVASFAAGSSTRVVTIRYADQGLEEEEKKKNSREIKAWIATFQQNDRVQSFESLVWHLVDQLKLTYTPPLNARLVYEAFCQTFPQITEDRSEALDRVQLYPRPPLSAPTVLGALGKDVIFAFTFPVIEAVLRGHLNDNGLLKLKSLILTNLAHLALLFTTFSMGGGRASSQFWRRDLRDSFFVLPEIVLFFCLLYTPNSWRKTFRDLPVKITFEELTTTHFPLSDPQLIMPTLDEMSRYRQHIEKGVFSFGHEVMQTTVKEMTRDKSCASQEAYHLLLQVGYDFIQSVRLTPVAGPNEEFSDPQPTVKELRRAITDNRPLVRVPFRHRAYTATKAFAAAAVSALPGYLVFPTRTLLEKNPFFSHSVTAGSLSIRTLAALGHLRETGGVQDVNSYLGAASGDALSRLLDSGPARKKEGEYRLALDKKTIDSLNDECLSAQQYLSILCMLLGPEKANELPPDWRWEESFPLHRELREAQSRGLLWGQRFVGLYGTAVNPEALAFDSSDYDSEVERDPEQAVGDECADEV